MSISLYNIESALLQLAELREAAEQEGDAQAVAVIDQQIGEYLDREPAKVDSCCAILRKSASEADACVEESRRLAARAKAIRSRMERWEESWLRAMKLRDIKELKTPTNTMRRQLNGVKQALEITDRSAVPPGYCRVDVTMSLSSWDAIQFNLPEIAKLCAAEQTPNTDAIREALSRRVECPECSEYPTTVCPRCQGSGTISATVPGARLLPREEHLRIL